MRRLKDDIGIVEDRTAEWEIEFNTEWQIFMHKKKTPNKFIDIDTLVITGKGLLNGKLVPFIIKTFYYMHDSKVYAEIACFDHENSSGDIGTENFDDSHTIQLNSEGSGTYPNLDVVAMDNIMGKGFESLSDIHIYYAYTLYQYRFSHEV